jgi:ATP-dependent DNA helicase RecQ
VDRAEQLRAHRAGELARLVDYVESGACRRRAILDHFGDAHPVAVDPQRCCDACAGRSLLREAPAALVAWDDLQMESRIALGLLDAVRRQPWPVGRRTLARVLVGSKAAGMERYERNPYYGRLSVHSEDDVDGFYRQLLLAGYLRVSGGDRPVLELTALGSQAIDHREAVPLDLASGRAPGRQRGARAVPAALNAEGEALFERLRTWRSREAAARKIPPYVVFDDKTLRALAAARPASGDALLAVRGVGPAKRERYGDDLLAIVTSQMT